MKDVNKFAIFFDGIQQEEQIEIILKEFLLYFEQRSAGLILIGIGKPMSIKLKTLKTWRVIITAKPGNIRYICQKFIHFLNNEDYLDTSTKVLYVTKPY